MRLGVLTKYLIRLHVGPFLFALTAITGIIFLNAVALRIDDLVGKGLPWTVILEFLVLSLPHVVALSLPMSVLVAVLFAFSELTSANEITAMSAGGIRPARVLMPLLVMGTIVTGTMLYFNDYILPESNHALKNLLLDISRKSPTLQFREVVVNEIDTEGGFETFFLTAERIDPASNTLEEVTIFDGNDPERPRTTYAARGQMAFNEARTDLYLTLFDGVVHEVQRDRAGGFQRLYFEEQIVPLRDVGNELERNVGSDRSDREMSFGLLAENARDREGELNELKTESIDKAVIAVRIALGEPVDDSVLVGSVSADRRERLFAQNTSLFARDLVTQELVTSSRSRASRGEALAQTINRFKVEFHKKLAIAFACMVFTLIGPPLALRFPRGGVGMVVGTSTAIFGVYWAGLIGGESLADRQFADPAVTMWLSNAVFLALALVLVSRMSRAASTVRGGGKLGEFWFRLRTRVTGQHRSHAQAVG